MCVHLRNYSLFFSLESTPDKHTHTHPSLWTEFWETREELIDPSFSDHHAPGKQIIRYQREKKWLPKA